MNIDFKEVENKIKCKLEEEIVGNMYECTEFPMELVDKPLTLTHELIISKLEKGLNIDVELDDLNNILMVSITEPVSKSEVMNISYSVKKVDDYKLIIRAVLISIKPYVFENYDDIIEKQNKYIESIIKEQIDQENSLLLDNVSTDYLSKEEFNELNK